MYPLPQWKFTNCHALAAGQPFADREMKVALGEAVIKVGDGPATSGRNEAFVREDLGDARSFSLDTPASRAPRIQALRAAASK